MTQRAPASSSCWEAKRSGMNWVFPDGDSQPTRAQTLGLPWDIDLLHDQDVGGGIAWASGSFPLVVVFGALFLQWLREDRNEAKAYDERADDTEDEDLEAYNQMLARMNKNGS